MPQEQQLAHRVLGNLALPYVTNIAPASTDPHYVSGSVDILTSINSYAERRPGFADAVEITPTTFHNLQRLFTWDRTDGTFYDMACDINASGFAQVFQMISGGDHFISIFTDTVGTPFDFVVSNNTIYFSNGHVAKKWDPVNGLSNWGIAIGSIANSTNAYCGTGADLGGGNPWANPTRIQGAPDASYATNSFTAIAGGFAATNILSATNYGFAIPAGVTVTGVQVDLTGFVNTTGFTQAFVSLIIGGVITGTPHNIVMATTPATYTVGSSSDLWGTAPAALNSGTVNASTFGVSITASITNGTGGSITRVYSMDAAKITIYYLGGPPISVAGGAGTMTATAGYTYVFCYGNSATGHISSPTPPSLSTGVFTNKANVSVTLTASTDPQVNQIRVFRTTDGGGGTYFELPTSPYPNSSGAILDSAQDSALIVSSIAPTPNFNDPPTPGQSAVFFSGRIWMFNGNKVWFSGLEEINQGVPEESFPSGIAGNFFAYDEPVTACSVSGTAAGGNQTQLTFCGGRIYAISGTTLDTFQRAEVSRRRGCRNLETVTVMGGMCAWLDSSNQVWATDGSSLQELSQDIRPSLTGLNPANCSMSFHAAGRFHWLVLNTGSQTFVYDIDRQQWMPPWSFGANYLFSGEISPGNYVLMAATTTKALQLNVSKFNDNGVTYQPVIVTQLFSTVPDFGSRFSYVAVGSYNEPTRTGYPDCFGILNNNRALSDVQAMTDDDPTQATFSTLVPQLATPQTAFNRKQGTFLQQLDYRMVGPACRWISFKIIMANADQTDYIYELFMSYKGLGGR